MDFTSEEKIKLKEIKDSLHREPELSHKEYKTTAKIKKYLDKLGGFEYLDLGLETGLIAILNGSNPGPTVGIRADIDAIEQIEESDVEVKSEISGLMHGCGHDFHTVAGLGTATLFKRNPDFNGRIVFIFQPAEETTTGTRYLESHGLFEKIKFDYIIGEHNRPELEVGQVAIKEGALMSAKNNYRIEIDGVGGHGSMPHKCVDPIVCASQMVSTLQSVVSRNIDPIDSCVLSIDYINGGNLDHLVVDHVDMQGTVRCLSHESHRRAKERIEKIVQTCGEMYECKTKFNYDVEIPLLYNSKEMCDIARRACIRAVGESGIVSTEPTLASEDFAIYSDYAKTFFYWIGSRTPGEPCYSWHNRKFKTDYNAIYVAAQVLYETAVELVK